MTTSFQVIDKLTRCMKAIIRDHEEMRNGTNHDSPTVAYDIRSTSISPVYSIADEDRNQLTQVAQERGGGNEEVTTDIDIIDLTNMEDDDNSNNKTATECNVEVEIHRGISNLSLQDVAHTLKDRTEDTNCSQSILNNFVNVENMQQNKVNNITPGSTAPIRVVNFSDINKANTIFQTNKISKDDDINEINNKNSFPQTLSNLNTDIILKRPMSICETKYNLIASASGETKGVKVVQPNVSIPNNNIFTANQYFVSNISKSQIQTYTDRTCTINTFDQHTNITQTPQNKVNETRPFTNIIAPNFGVPTHSHHEVTKTKHILNNNKTLKVAKNKKNTTNSMAIAHSAISEESKKTKTPRKSKGTSIDKNIPKTKTDTRKAIIMPVKGKHKKVPIYNKNVIDDLSWIENIRYIREIDASENDCKLQLEDDFWDNYYLPANWNDNEFA